MLKTDIAYVDALAREAKEKEWLMLERAVRAEAINRDLREKIAKFKDAAEECAFEIPPLNWKIENLESDLAAAKEDVASYREALKSAADCTDAQRERAIRAEAKNRDLQERAIRAEGIARRLSNAVRESEYEIKCLKGALGDIAAAENKVFHLKAEAEFLEDEIAFIRGG